MKFIGSTTSTWDTGVKAPPENLPRELCDEGVDELLRLAALGEGTAPIYGTRDEDGM